MNVSSIDPRLTQANKLDLVSANSGVTPALDACGDQRGSCRASVSPLAHILSQLQQLQQTDPAKLKTVLTDIANRLQAAAQQASGSEGQALSNLASKFQQAAQTGNLSALQPGHHHHHGHRHGAAAAYQQTSDPSADKLSVASQTDRRSPVLDIIDTVLKQDLGTTGTASA